VVILYHTQPDKDSNHPFSRSFTGLALFTPELDLLERYPESVIGPEEPIAYDYVGVEDVRMTRINKKFKRTIIKSVGHKKVYKLARLLSI